MITLRLGRQHTSREGALELLDAIKKHPGSCDCVWFSTLYGYPTLEEHRREAENIAEAAELFRKEGIRVSLQISNTFGHGEYMKTRPFDGLKYDGSRVRNMVGPDGTVSPWCFCWYDGDFRKYIAETTKLYAKIQPHGVWVDDDLRAVNHAPVEYGCFCEDCIGRFNKLHGTSFSREELVHEINRGDEAWRKKYIDFIREGIKEVAVLITDAVLSVSPESVMAYQCARDINYLGMDLNHVFEGFYEKSGRAPMVRPGGGFYSDKNPQGMIYKSLLLNYTCAGLPDYVTERCMEIENTPDVAFGKSNEGTCIETSLHLAYGCTSISYATFMTPYEKMSRHEKMLEMFAGFKPYWERLGKVSRETVCGGVCVYPMKNSYLKNLNESDEDFSWIKAFIDTGIELVKCAVPISHDAAGARVFLLSGEMVDFLSEDDIELLLNRPVVLDAHAADKIIKRGYADRINAKIYPAERGNLKEILTDHAVNEEFSGMPWTESFFTGRIMPPCFIEGGEPIGMFADSMSGEILGTANSICSTYDKNGRELAKWAVFGYSIWKDIISSAKRTQIMNAIDYISGKTMPAVLKSCEQVVIIPRVDVCGRTVSVTALNASIGRTDSLELKIRNPIGESFFVMKPEEELKPVSAKKADDEYILSLPPLDGWEIVTVFMQ